MKKKHYPHLFPREYNSEKAYIHEYITKVRKNGHQGTRLHSRFVYLTPLNKCDLCYRVSTPKNVNYRPVTKYLEKSDAQCEFLQDYLNLWYLCTSCWNKCVKISYEEQKHDQLRRLINKLKDEITNAKRKPNATV